MLEERLFLILSYLLIASLLLLFCFFTPFSRKVKLTGIFVVAAFYFSSWNSYINILGWPSTEDLPEKFRISWVVIQEPSKGDRKEGGLYLWIRKLNEVNDEPVKLIAEFPLHPAMNLNKKCIILPKIIQRILK